MVIEGVEMLVVGLFSGLSETEEVVGQYLCFVRSDAWRESEPGKD